MKKLLISIALIASSVGLGYLAYYLIKIELPIWAIVVFSVAVVALIVGVVFACLFANRKNGAKIASLQDRLKLWTNISYHVTQAGDEVFNKLPIGIILYDDSYNIKWSNEHAKKVFPTALVDQPLSTISAALLDCVTQTKPTMILKYNDYSYDVIHNPENNILYFFDVTKREDVIKKYNERITAIGIIGIDNLDESLKKFDMQEKANIRGEILGEISDWAEKYNCYLQALADDRMIVLADREHLELMVNDKFSMLQKVRDIAQRNRLKASISMGVSCYDVLSDELGPLAQNAIELAERRGGDQVVVNIQGEKVQFFGGNLNSLEKNTLVEARMQTMALKEAIEASSNVLLMCHNLADCDAIGSMIAASHLVKSSHKDYKMVFDPEKADVTVKKIYQEIVKDDALKSNFVNLEEALGLVKGNTLLVITDTQSPKLLMFRELYDKVPKISVVDHHRAGDEGYRDCESYYVETSASSAVELISEMFMFYSDQIVLTPLEASIMLAGIIVDTNNFTFRSSARTFEAASLLKSMGGDMAFARKFLRESMDSELQIAKAFMHAEVVHKRFAIVALDENEIITDRTALAKISDKLLTIEGIDTSFTIGRINEKTVGVSARSLDGINVQIVMEEMGGGGHFNGAATQIDNATIAEVKNMLLEILKRDYFDEGEEEKVKVILLDDVKGKGKKDQIIDVANGYANYLLTNKLALAATPENIENLKKQQAQEKIDEENRRNVLEKIKTEIQDKYISIFIKLGADGKAFGHITKTLICDEFESQTGIHLDKKKVEIPAEINSVGIFTASVKLDKDIVATFEVNVKSEK